MIERSIRYGFLVLIAVLLASCNGGSPGNSDNSGSNGNSGGGSSSGGGQTAEIAQLSAGSGNGTAQTGTTVLVFADITDTDGNPVSGQQVSFSTSLGSLSDSMATTNSNGRASVTLTASQNLGTAVVTMSAEGFSDSVTIGFVAGLPDSVDFSASPTTLGFNRSSDLVITVLDEFGNPVSNQTVQLSVNPNNSGGAFTNVLVTTDSNGRATGEYTTGSSAGSDTLIATASSVTDSAVITVDPNAVALNSMTLVSGSPEIVADGAANTFIRATILDTDNRPVQGVNVSFNSSAGTLDASSDVTDANGRAEVRLTSGTRVATAQVTASVGGLNEAIEVGFVAGPADLANSSITANPTSLAADGVSTTTIVVTLADSNNNPVSNDTQVTLQTGAGTITTANPINTTLGRAEFELQAPANPANTTVSVQQLPGLETQVRFGSTSSGNPASIQIDANPQEITVAGVGQEEQASINLSILDDSGNPIDESGYGDSDLNNVRVTLVTRPNGGEVITGTDASGDPVTSSGTGLIDVRSDNGSVTLNLQSGTLPGVVEAEVKVLDFDGTDFTNSGDVAATASLPQITIASGPPHTIAFTSPITNSITNEGGGVYSRIGTLIVTDRFGNAVPDGTSINLGLVDSVIAKGQTGVVSAGSPMLSESSFDFDTRCSSATSCAAEAFDFMSTITRNGVARGIEKDDRVLIQNSQAEDKSRFVSAVTGSNSIDVQTNYVNGATGLKFVVGTSALGGEIFGEQNGLTKGSVTTVDGLAPFRVFYPANLDTILTGCLGTLPDGTYVRDDKRREVPQSAQLYVVAYSSDNKAVGVDRGQFCFAAIAGINIEARPTTTDRDATVSLEVTDGGDGILLPFAPVSATVQITNRESGSTFDVTATVNNNLENGKAQTGISGTASAEIDLNCDDGGICLSGDSAEVTFFALDGEATVEVSIP